MARSARSIRRRAFFPNGVAERIRDEVVGYPHAVRRPPGALRAHAALAERQKRPRIPLHHGLQTRGGHVQRGRWKSPTAGKIRCRTPPKSASGRLDGIAKGTAPGSSNSCQASRPALVPAGGGAYSSGTGRAISTCAMCGRWRAWAWSIRSRPATAASAQEVEDHTWLLSGAGGGAHPLRDRARRSRRRTPERFKVLVAAQHRGPFGSAVRADCGHSWRAAAAWWPPTKPRSTMNAARAAPISDWPTSLALVRRQRHRARSRIVLLEYPGPDAIRCSPGWKTPSASSTACSASRLAPAGYARAA